MKTLKQRRRRHRDPLLESIERKYGPLADEADARDEARLFRATILRNFQDDVDRFIRARNEGHS
jgi:hypothetical protein